MKTSPRALFSCLCLYLSSAGMDILRALTLSIISANRNVPCAFLDLFRVCLPLYEMAMQQLWVRLQKVPKCRIIISDRMRFVKEERIRKESIFQ